MTSTSGPAASAPEPGWLVADAVRSGIRQGALDVGGTLTEEDLRASLGSSRSQVREGLEILAREGFVSRVRGHGTRVVQSMTVLPLDDIVSVSGESIDILVHARYETGTSSLVREVLGVKDGPVGMVEHLFEIAGEPVGARIAYHARGTRVPARLGASPRLEDAFLETFGVRLDHIDSAVEVLPCDHRTAELLQTTAGEPLLMCEQRLVDTDGRTRELGFAHYLASRVCFAIEGA